jgi:hypothetical protein
MIQVRERIQPPTARMVHRSMTTLQGEVYEAAPAPQQLEDGRQLTTDELVEVNLGTEEEPRPTFVSSALTPLEKRKLSRIPNGVPRLLCMVI